MKIRHNIIAKNSYRQYKKNVSALGKNLEKLSSGYQINRAADNAAGLAISEKMRAQITGLDQAQDNVQDGISLVQTAEGALQEIHDMLNRMVSLATQSANGTYDNSVDRANLQKEAEALQQEIDRISKSTNFNHIPLLDGSLDDGGGAIDKNFTIGGSGTGSLPLVGDVLGNDTILHTTAALGQKTEFTIDLSNVSFSNALGASLSIVIGSATITVAGAASGGNQMNTSDIISSILQGTNNQTNTITGVTMASDGVTPLVTIYGQEFSLENAGNGKLKLTQVDVPSSVGEVVNGNLNVTVSGNGVTIAGTAGVPGQWNYEIKNAFEDGETLTIAGKTITFSAGGNGSDVINIHMYATAEAQVEAVKNLFASDGTFVVSNSGNDLTFTQKTPDTGYVFSPPVTGGGTPSGRVSGITVDTPYQPAYQGTAKLTITTQPNDGTFLYIKEGVYVTFTSTPSNGRVQIGSTISDTVRNLAQFLNDTVGIEATVYTDGMSLIIKDVNSQDITSIGCTKGPTSPTFTQITAANGTTPGKWSLTWNLTDSPMMSGDAVGFEFSPDTGIKFVEMVFGNKDYDEDGGDHINIGKHTTLDAQIAQMAKLLNLDENLGKHFSFAASGGVLTIEQKNPSSTEYVLNPWNVYAGNGLNLDPILSSTQLEPSRPAVAESYEVSFDSFASGDQLTVSYGSFQKLISFYDSNKGESGGTDYIDVSTLGQNNSGISKAIANILGNQFSDFTILTANGNSLTFEQNTAGVGDGTTISFQSSKISTGSGVFTQIQTAEDAIPSGNSMIRPTTDVINGTISSANQLASTFFTLTKDMVTEGNSIRIGDTIYLFGDNDVKISDLDPTATDYLLQVAQRLVAAAARNGTWTVTNDGSKIVLEEVPYQTNFDLSSPTGILASLGYTVFGEGGLILQIGETGDKYNRLSVTIPKMDSAALGIDPLDISAQNSAQNTIDCVRKAINTVSAVRGSLGSIQNRLEHTLNSLSITKENIQDSESTIRDTNIADEMMDYTKNNILIQSAQAMLAQANQAPQSVLSLLQ